MKPTRLFRLTATVTGTSRAEVADRYGDPTEETETTTVKCWLEQKTRDENTVNADLAGERWDLYLPPDTPVKASDRFTIGGVEYELDGPPWAATHPRTTEVTHIEASVRRTA